MPTPQSPIASGFGAASTAAEVIKGVDLTGKTIVVTGGYSGIGIETVRVLHGAGTKIFVPARDMMKAVEALAAMPNVVIAKMDLLDPASIDRFAEQILSSTDRLDILINNAGVMAAPLSRDARGYETQFAANHLGHFQLTCRLWPALARAEGARVVALSSYGHRRAGVDFRDPNFDRRPYDRWEAYGQSKTANSLFAVALDSIGRRHEVRAFAVHPGGIFTPLVRHMPQAEIDASAIIDADGSRSSTRKITRRLLSKARPRRSGAQPARNSMGWAASIVPIAISPPRSQAMIVRTCTAFGPAQLIQSPPAGCGNSASN